MLNHYMFLILMLSLYQCTPLHVTAHNGHDFTVDCLVMKGADVNIKNKNGVSMHYLISTVDLRMTIRTSILIVPWNRMGQHGMSHSVPDSYI